METIQLRPYQRKAIDSVREALCRKQRHIIVEMSPGSGKGIVFTKIVEFLHKTKNYKLLVVVDHVAIKKQIISRISANYNGFSVVETSTAILKNPDKQKSQYEIVIFYDAIVSHKVYDALLCAEKTVIVFTTIGDEPFQNGRIQKKLFLPSDKVFTYTFQEAINDGYVTPAMDTRALEPAIEVFSMQLLA